MGRILFDPPLRIQRQAWVLSQLDHFDAKSVLEVGCNNAPLMQALLPPPLYVTPSEKWRKSGIKATGIADHSIFKPGPIAPQKIVILDIDPKALKEPMKKLRRASLLDSQRWYNLLVKVICGSLDDDYTEQIGQSAFVLSIEHLPDSILSNFASSMLSGYRPKVLLVTTPNYSFNERFEGGISDPTGRTDRVFRHDDHKFEWTRSEFEDWCQSCAKEHQYNLLTGGVGEAVESDVESTDENRFASQFAVFTRKEDNEYISPRPSFARLHSTPISKLDNAYQANLPEDIVEKDVIRLTQDIIIEIGEEVGINHSSEADLWSIWMDPELRFLVRGEIDVWFEILGISFVKGKVYCKGDITLMVKHPNLYLSCTLRVKVNSDDIEDKKSTLY